MTKEIQLTQNKVAFVDDSDFGWLNQWKWHLTHYGYAARTIWVNSRSQKIWMHRLIMEAPPGLLVDHINGNGCDNRRDNLRLCTHKQNLRYCGKHMKNASSKYKGV